MPEENIPSPKYQIDQKQAQGSVIGDNAHVTQSFANVDLHLHLHSSPSPIPTVTREEFLHAIHEANAELRHYPDTIAGIHIERPEVDQIIEWIRQADAKEQVGMVLDQPGSGKTVVMHDVLLRLENEGIPVLAIKADFLSGIRTRSELADRLGLPNSVEACAHQLGAEGLFVVLLDQLDALSLSLSRDQATLDVMLSTLAHLRNIDRVRILASCRTFDLNNDPKLSQIKVDRKFTLRPLPDEEINCVLQAIGVRPEYLLPAHRSLLATPLHLEIYVRLIEPGAAGQQPESFYSLQELYQALWRKHIEVMPPDTPTPTERIKAIDRLVEVMQQKRQIAVPIATLDDHIEAAVYLERVSIIRREGNNWLFFHQTLFDYCYARRFVALGHTLSQEILPGPQDLFARSQMIQVLAYLRGADEPAYHRELRALLFAKDLRIHLRLLLIGWFGSLPNPTEAELRIARRLMQNRENQARFLQAARGNGSWFDQLRGTMLPLMLRSRDEQQVNLAVGMLAALIEERTEDVLAHLQPFLGSSETWDERIAYCLNHIKSWRSDAAVELLCDLFRRRRIFGRESSFLYDLQANPAVGCRVLRIYLDTRLNDILTQLQLPQGDTSEPDGQLDLRDSFKWDKYLLGEHAVGKFMKHAVQICPNKMLEHILSWFVQVAMALDNTQHIEDTYPFGFLFASGWYGDHLSNGARFAQQMAHALHQLAKESPHTFRPLADSLAQLEALAIQRVLVTAYLSNPAVYADDIFVYLTADSRRLKIGEPTESSHYDSLRLVAAVFPYLTETQRQTLEALILDYHPTWEHRGIGRLGRAQLHFLKAIPIELLGEKARRRRQELEHKFPGFRLRPPQGVTGGWVGPPIGQEAQAKMPDEAWLQAMRKYDDDTEWGGSRRHLLQGGVLQLSRSFTEQVKQDPARFYQLAQRFDETISLHYVAAAISGLAESDAPSEWVFDLVRRFAHRLEGEFRRSVCWALSKRAKDSVPDDLLDLMTDWARHDPDPTEELWCVTADSGQPYYGGDAHTYGINTNRGAAIGVAAHSALKRTPPQFERVFTLLEWVAEHDPSTAVRACVIKVMGPLLGQDVNRTLAIFARTVAGHPALLQTPLAHRFLSWVYRDHFQRIRPYIEILLAHQDDSTRQAGARLACLAAFFYPEANELADQALTGDSAMRRGAAQVYARNLSVADISNVCRQRLLVLMDDPNENVREEVGRCFEDLQPEQMGEIRPFIDAFILSPALLAGVRHLINYLKPLTADEQEMALQITTHILDMAGTDLVDIRTSTAILERDLVRLPLAVYTHATDPELKSQAMSLFERLLLIGSRSADQALADWDRR